LNSYVDSQPAAPKVVSFDCAQTLLEVQWSVRRYIADVCYEANLEIPWEGPAIYEEMHRERLGEYLRVNLTRDHAQCDEWWIQLGRDWLAKIGMDPDLAAGLHRLSDEIGFGPESILFQAYDDVVPTLNRLAELEIKTAVLSNWDYTLHKSLRGAGLYDRFDLVVASLEYGVEKPDPRLFHVLVEHFDVRPEEILHIGDNPVDDLEGARSAGLRGALIDRSRTHFEEPWLHDLSKIEEAFRWTG
jgi:putative hydrolase of the HAD superfamily